MLKQVTQAYAAVKAERRNHARNELGWQSTQQTKSSSEKTSPGAKKMYQSLMGSDSSEDEPGDD